MLRTQLGEEVRGYDDQIPTRVGGGTQKDDGLCWRDQERTRKGRDGTRCRQAKGSERRVYHELVVEVTAYDSRASE